MKKRNAGPVAERVALSWLMMMYARTDPSNDEAAAKLEDCYHLLHFGHWPRFVGSTNYCQRCNLFLSSVPGLGTE